MMMNISLLSISILILTLLCHGWPKLWLIKTKDGTIVNDNDGMNEKRTESGVEYGLDYKDYTEYKDYEVYEDYMDNMKL